MKKEWGVVACSLTAESRIQRMMTMMMISHLLAGHVDWWRRAGLVFRNDGQNTVDDFQDAILFVHLDNFDVRINTFIQQTFNRT